jgi:Na+-transporting methylmalonyl-CoA/oxaloacetate decarboxylase gamma subunit
MENVYRISLIGAGLVIVGLMILWFMMELLVRLTRDRKITQSDTPDDMANESPAVIDSMHHQKAAAVAAAVAIALRSSSLVLPEQDEERGLTAWQSISRQRQMHNLPHRK